MRRRLAAPLAAALMAGLALAGPVSADTTGAPNGNEDGLYLVGSWEDGTTIYTATVNLIVDRYNAQNHLFVTLSRGMEVTCEGGTPGYEYREVSGSGTPSSATFGRRLASAAAAGTVTGVASVYDSCTDTWSEQSGVSATIAVTALANGASTTTTSRSVTIGADGSRTTLTEKTVSREASGRIRVDGGAWQDAEHAEIYHREWKSTSR